MAYFGAQRRIPEGQCTQTIYTLIKEQKFQEAITHLNIELQVFVDSSGSSGRRPMSKARAQVNRPVVNQR